ncbi:MAG: type II toxin-antitoxin system RelE/ParE family toxin [Candidatus Hinthialibacter sp.]
MDQIEKIVWTERGIDSLESIVEFISSDSAFYASRFAKRIVQLVEALQDFPLMGRITPEFNNPSIRELIYHNYRVVYKLDRQAVYVLLVCHGMQTLPNIPHTQE